MYPFISLWGIQIPTYGLCACIAVFLGSILAFRKARKIGIDNNDLLIIIAVSLGFAVLCSNLLYIFITYDLKTIFEQLMQGNISFFQKTGIIFYGGLIGGVFSAIITSKILKIKIDQLEKCIVPYIPLGHAIGRVGCLLAGCCYGFSYNGIFAVTTHLNPEHGSYFPIQGVEAIFNVLIGIVLIQYNKKDRAVYSITCLYAILYACLRFTLEFFRGDSIRGKMLCFSTSQWISLAIFFVSVVVLLITRRKKLN